MTSHIFHPGAGRIGADTEPILYDGCPRCEEHAEKLLELDRDFMGALWRKMVAVEFDDEGRYRSEAEARACRRLREIAVWLERYASVDVRGMAVGSPPPPSI